MQELKDSLKKNSMKIGGKLDELRDRVAGEMRVCVRVIQPIDLDRSFFSFTYT